MKGFKKGLKISGWILLILLYWLVLLLGIAPIWAQFAFGGITMDQVMYHLFVTSKGTPITVYWIAALFALVIPALIILLTIRLPRILRHLKLKPKIAKMTSLVLVLALATACIYVNELQIGPFRYVLAQLEDSSFIEDHYVDPRKVDLVFPREKRNLIYIWSESMEASFQDTKNGGCRTENVIEPLTRLARQHVSFSHNQQTGGFFQVTTATYTIGGMTAQSSGLPLITPFHLPNDTPEGDFLPGMVNLGDILKQQGYRNVFLCGSDADFGRNQELFIQHGDYQIHDLKWMYDTGVVPRDYHVWWGAEDAIVFRTAKAELTRLAQTNQPFNLQMALLDTHAQDGYLSEASSRKFKDQYSNVLAGSARQIADFVAWVQKQPWAEQTTIVIVGDHLSMDRDYPDDFVQGTERSVFNCFIGAKAALNPGADRKRIATSLDLFPTTLAALGVSIKGEKLGLGVNLFSGRKTLAEEVGLERINREFEISSPFYNRTFHWHHRGIATK